MKEKYFKSSFQKRMRTMSIVAAFAVMFAVIGITSAINEFPTASISGMKFSDLNANGIKDAGEPGLANWTIMLTLSGQEFPITTLTDSNGSYIFSGLAPSNYTVGEVLQTGWAQTAPQGGTYKVTLGGEDVSGLDFGNFNQPDHPYLILITTSGTPNTAEPGSTVSAFGRNFCSAQGCSAVNLTIGNEFASQQTITSLSVQSDGTFATSFTVNVPFPWLYIVTANQTIGDGSTITAYGRLIVPASDPSEEEIEEPPKILANTQHFLVTSPTLNILSSSNPAVTEFPPNVKWGGRGVAVDVSRANNAFAIVASESGGLWKTMDTGATWSHLDGLPPFRMSDVKLAPGNDQIIIATAWADSHTTNSGGIWRSIDGGATWDKPTTADPSPGTGCPILFNAWGISFASGTNDVFVGTDCGVSISHDLGATWTHVVPDRRNSTNFAVYGISAQQGVGGSIVDTFGADGHHRSTDSGSTWTPTNAASPVAPFIGVHTIVTSPLESNVLFAAVGGKNLYESDDGGTSWTNINPNQPTCCGRGPWVATHISPDGNLSHFDIYFGGGVTTIKQTCTNTGGPGLRCSTTWNPVTVDHADQNDLAFSTSSNCAQFIVSDGGIHTTPDCGSTWQITGSGTGGYHALQVYEMIGQVHPDHTDLYFGTQDNDLWASGDNGSTWPKNVCCEGWYIQMPHNSPTDAGQTITYVDAGPPLNSKSSAHFVSDSWGGWNNPPSGGMATGSPFVIDQGVYIQWNATNPPINQLYITTDTGVTWTAVTGANITLQLIDRPFVSGPPANPIIYQEVQRPGGWVGLIKITGVRSGTATISNADSGLNNIGFWSMGQGTWRWAQVFAVDPNNPQHLMAADIGNNQMMVSTNGGASWNPNNQLTNLVTSIGTFRFSQPSTTLPGLTTQVHSIAFDPSNSNRIIVGTEQAGIIASLDGGATWGKLPGSEIVPAVSSFFFDEVRNDVMASTYGRGLWKLDLSKVPGIISGVKFEDINGNRIKEPGEPGLAGWNINLIDSNGNVVVTNTTDLNGNYILVNVAPNITYTVVEDLQPGWLQTAPAGGAYTVSLSTGEHVKDKDFGNFKLGKISGMKYEDINGNGLKDPGDPGLSGWTIKLNGQNGTTITTVTDASGNYKFENLTADKYTVGEILPSSWIQTAPAVSLTGSATYTITISTSGQNETNKDFGNFKFGEVDGQKFEDLNANGIRDNDDFISEIGLSGWQINLTGTDTITNTPVSVTTTTDTNGNYEFTGLTAGTYTVTETLQNGWIQTAPSSVTYTVTITSGSNITGQDFGNFHKGKITGGGWISITGDPKATFGITGQYPDSKKAAQGNAEYQDHKANLNIKSIQINTSATTLDKKKGALTGLAQVNGKGSYPFVVYVEDNAEPGKDVDLFKISLPTYPYSNGAVLSSGNVQIHN